MLGCRLRAVSYFYFSCLSERSLQALATRCRENEIKIIFNFSYVLRHCINGDFGLCTDALFVCLDLLPFQLQMLGYDISWAAFNIIEVMSSSKFTFKVRFRVEWERVD